MTRAELHASAARKLRALADELIDEAAESGDPHCLDTAFTLLTTAADREALRALTWRRAAEQVARAEALELAREAERRVPAPF